MAQEHKSNLNLYKSVKSPNFDISNLFTHIYLKSCRIFMCTIHSLETAGFKSPINLWNSFSGRNKKFICGKCNRKYEIKGSLSRHLKYECGKDPQFSCTVFGCKYKSKIKGNIKHHIAFKHKPDVALKWIRQKCIFRF